MPDSLFIQNGDEMGSPYAEIWSRLNQTNLDASAIQALAGREKSEFANVLEYFKRTNNVRTVNLLTLSGEEEQYLSNCGLSRQNLVRNFKKAITGWHMDARAFQLAALRDGALYAFSPFSGERLKSRHSLLANLNTIFYRFEGQQVFYVAIAGIGYGFQKCALYLPKWELLLTVGADWTIEIDDVIELKARMVNGAGLCLNYLANSDARPRKTAVCFGYYHFAHHLWNELSGIHRIQSNGLIKYVDKWLALREPLGPITEIFPEIPASKVEKQNNTAQLFETIVREGYFAVRIGGIFIPKELMRRVNTVAQKRCNPATVAKIAEAKKNHTPLLWVGIRIGTRAWANQVDGISELLIAVQERYPKLGVIFDGFSVPADKSENDPEYTSVIQLENDVVAAIEERLDRQTGTKPALFNIIGASVFDATVWANAIDFYVSPYGTVQHKVGWMANKPGVIHTNQTLLKNPAKYIWAAIDGAIRPRYLNLSAVEDVRSAAKESVIYRDLSDASESGAGILAGVAKVRGNNEFDNYVVDGAALRNELFDLLKAPDRANQLSASDIAHWSKTQVRKLMQGLTNTFDFSKM
jgi:hypothetical protein